MQPDLMLSLWRAARPGCSHGLTRFDMVGALLLLLLLLLELLLSDGLVRLPTNRESGDRKSDRIDIWRAMLGCRDERIFLSESSWFRTLECVFAREKAVATRGAKCEREWMRLLGYGMTGLSIDRIAMGAFFCCLPMFSSEATELPKIALPGADG